MNIKRIQLHKWMFRLWLLPRMDVVNGYDFQFGFFKLKSLPPEGEIFSKKHYKGFWIVKKFMVKGFAINL